MPCFTYISNIKYSVNIYFSAAIMKKPFPGKPGKGFNFAWNE